MEGAVNYIKGTVRVKVRARYEERVINICTYLGIKFWNIERGGDGNLEFTTTIGGYRKLRRAAEKNGSFTVKPISRKGVPFLMWKVRKRYILLAGLGVFIFMMTISSMFIWQIEVRGNEKVSTEEILGALGELGVDIGTNTFKLNNRMIQNNMLLMIPELSWITVNTQGSRAVVIVREKLEKPEIIDYDKPTKVVAEKTGIIEKITVLRGIPLVEEGDTVLEGDVLLDGDGGRADGEIIARTWYTMEEIMPLSGEKKEYTGHSTVRYSIKLGKKYIKLYFSGRNPYTDCDKITMEKAAVMPDGSVLPFGLRREEFIEYETKEESFDLERCLELMEKRLLSRLSEEIDDGEIVSYEFNHTLTDGAVTLTMKAQCLENIALVRSDEDLLYSQQNLEEFQTNDRTDNQR